LIKIEGILLIIFHYTFLGVFLYFFDDIKKKFEDKIVKIINKSFIGYLIKVINILLINILKSILN
jgi:hypothetical protein